MAESFSFTGKCDGETSNRRLTSHRRPEVQKRTVLNLLASAIPGLRDLRAPLVAGYLWLLAIWLALGPSVPVATHAAPGVARSVVDLTQTVGPAATAAGVSILAYVIGAISVSLPGVIAGAWQRSWLAGAGPFEVSEIESTYGGQSSRDVEPAALADRVTQLRKTVESYTTSPSFFEGDVPFEVRHRGGFFRWLYRMTARQVGLFEISGISSNWRKLVEQLIAVESSAQGSDIDRDDAARALIRAARSRLWTIASEMLQVGPTHPPALEEVRERLADRWSQLSPRDLTAVLERAEEFGGQMWRELDLPNTLLVGDQPEIYAEADRARAEADFRLALVLPSAALVVVLIVAGGWWWLLGSLASAALLVTGAAKKDEARTFIRNSIESGKTPSIAARRFEEFVARRLSLVCACHQAFFLLAGRRSATLRRSVCDVRIGLCCAERRALIRA
jgi:hypothetical protein